MRENVNMKWRKSDLVARAKELGIEGVSMMNKAKLVAAMLERAAETAPDPCIFDAATCLTERAFEFVGQMWI